VSDRQSSPPSRRGHAAIAVTALLAPAALGACGGGDDDKPVVTRSEFASRAQQVCQRAADSYASVRDGHELKDTAVFAAENVRIGETALRSFADLTAPDGLDRQFDAFTGRLRESVLRARRLEQFARAGNEGPTHSMRTDVETARAEASDIATAMGLTACEKVAPQDSGH
jgi:hypothetical protein